MNEDEFEKEYMLKMPRSVLSVILEISHEEKNAFAVGVIMSAMAIPLKEKDALIEAFRAIIRQNKIFENMLIEKEKKRVIPASLIMPASPKKNTNE